MIVAMRVGAFAAIAIVLSSCGARHAAYGGAPEEQLAAAVMGADLQKASQLLASGADPNKVVTLNGDYQSSWFLSLTHVRPRQPASVEMVRLMLKSGANPNVAWGTSGAGSGPKESVWRRFWRTGARQAGLSDDQPMRVAMFHPVPDVVRALVSAGFDPRDGGAALVDAVEMGDVEIVHALVEAGVDVNVKGSAITPLVAAIEARNVALMTYLEQHGAREKP
jgi:hypothetical protein